MKNTNCCCSKEKYLSKSSEKFVPNNSEINCLGKSIDNKLIYNEVFSCTLTTELANLAVILVWLD